MGAGWGSTGTTSLSGALRHFDLNTCHCLKSLCMQSFSALDPINMSHPDDAAMSTTQTQECLERVRIIDYTKEVPAETEAIVDTPMAELFVDMILAFPNAKVILTKRPGLSWLRQRRGLFCHESWPMQEPCGKTLRSKHALKDEDMAQLLVLHDELVRCIVPPENLLEINLWTDTKERLGSLMQEIGNFIGKPLVKHVPFPRMYNVEEVQPNCDTLAGIMHGKCHGGWCKR